MSEAHDHPHDEPQEKPQPNPHYEAVNAERKALLDDAVRVVQTMQDNLDQHLVQLHGGAFFFLSREVLALRAHVLHLEQRLEELESAHRRHYHTDSGGSAQ